MRQSHVLLVEGFVSGMRIDSVKINHPRCAPADTRLPDPAVREFFTESLRPETSAHVQIRLDLRLRFTRFVLPEFYYRDRRDCEKTPLVIVEDSSAESPRLDSLASWWLGSENRA